MFIVEESLELNVVPAIPIDPSTTVPDPEGNKFISSFDLVPSMLLSLILMAGNSIEPVPDGANTKSSLVRFALMSCQLWLIPSLKRGDAYNSVKLSFTLIIASRKVSPVPSFAFDPTLSTSLVIIR